VRPSFKLIQKTDPRTFYETQQENFLLGKSEACGMVITDPHISDVQARVTAVPLRPNFWKTGMRFHSAKQNFNFK
jgi:hypothetical protein